ncbi:MAG: NERD domain-containing protein [Culicoidibacterales bacterium]
MNITQVTQLILIVGGIIAVVYGLVMNFSKLRLWWLKRQIRKQVNKLQQSGIEIIHDFMIPTGQGLCAIDAVVLAPQGVFLIQNFNYIGKIYGNEWKKKWLQKSRFRKQTFANPFYQLHTDGRELERILTLDHDTFIAMAIFPRTAKFQVLGQQRAIHAKDISQVIQDQQESVLTSEEVIQSSQILRRITISEPVNRQRLYQRMTEIEKVSAEKIHNGICPQCGSILMLKNSPTGHYKGCSSANCEFEVH